MATKKMGKGKGAKASKAVATKGGKVVKLPAVGGGKAAAAKVPAAGGGKPAEARAQAAVESAVPKKRIFVTLEVAPELKEKLQAAADKKAGKPRASLAAHCRDLLAKSVAAC